MLSTPNPFFQFFWAMTPPLPKLQAIFKWRETDNQLDAASVTIIEIEWSGYISRHSRCRKKSLPPTPDNPMTSSRSHFQWRRLRCVKISHGQLASYRGRWDEGPQWGPNTQRKAQRLGIFTGHQGCSFQEPRKCLHCRTRLWKMPHVSQKHLDICIYIFIYTCSL